MSYIKLPHVLLDDERWLAAGPEAFALHCAALVWCDRRLTDGKFPAAMVARASLAVDPARAQSAADALVAQGFWLREADSFVIVDYLDHAFPADQVKRTRARWKADKDRRRQHGLGDHSLCKDPKYCPAISTLSSTVESRGGRSHLDQTQSDQTRPDPTGGKGRGLGGEEGGDEPRSARATRGRANREEDKPAGSPSVDRHPYQSDDNGLDECATCGLPQRNGRHNTEDDS